MTARVSNWKRVPIKEVYLGLFDGPHATPTPSKEGPVFLGIKNVTDDGRLDLSDIRHISENEFPRWTKRVLPQDGDIVFTYEATLNRYALVPKGFRGCLGRRMALIRPNPEKVDNRFLFQYFFGADWRSIISKNILSGSTVDRIPLTKFPDFEISLPPLETQRTIASILSAYDDLIENNTRRIKILEEMARMIYREWFVNFRFPGYEQVKMVSVPVETHCNASLQRIPEGWGVRTLKDFGTIVTGKTPSTKVSENFGSFMPFIKTPDMHGNLFCIGTGEALTELGSASQKNKTIPPDSLCVSCIGTAGIVTITSVHAQTNQQINSIVLNDVAVREFMFFALLDLREVINQYGANGATMVNLNKSKFEVLEVICPNADTMKTFHELVFSHFEEIKVLQKKNQNLRQTRDLLLPKLISGEVYV